MFEKIVICEDKEIISRKKNNNILHSLFYSTIIFITKTHNYLNPLTFIFNDNYEMNKIK